jgi:RND superfamily putative drug exporter
LASVYRAPLLVAVPMISIGFAVTVSMAFVALLTKWSIEKTVPGLDLRVFTTSRIFVVVILFGAGTDYCLFLIARLREEAHKRPWPIACRDALRGVSGALMGSAMTTIVGLGMLWFADFGKFHYTGPIIAICLLVGLLVCTTLTPAMLRAIGPRVFWPVKIDPEASRGVSLLGSSTGEGRTVGGGLWGRIALTLTRWPGTALALGVLLLAAPAVYGYRNESSVTYDLSSQLSRSASSRQGLRLLTRHFPIGEINPVTILMVRPGPTPRDDLERQIKKLAEALYGMPEVATVRTVDDPLGDFPPDREMGLLSSDAWRRRALRNHRIARRYFFSDKPQYEDRLVRLDVTIDQDPFSIETARLVSDLRLALQQEAGRADSPWQGSQVLMAGTTPSIIDLRRVTMADNRLIKFVVVLAVFAVLVIVIRRVGLCVYLIATVLLSYYATMGLTILFFRQAYGSDFVGLDWKLPLFLFVILVAVGQDYNVYLVTRVLEEQQRLGWRAALRRAISRTGGIITACGLVMAATFFSMTASSWLPSLLRWTGMDGTGSRTALRGVVEMGFALGLGVLLDTFYVRTILVPSFVALRGRKSGRM